MRLAVLLIGLPALANAAVNPCALDGMVAAAPTAVQVGEVSVDERPRGPMGLHCGLSGVVVRSFRGSLASGAAVTADVPCRPLPDGIAGELTWHSPAALRAAGVVELHLDADGAPVAYGAGVMPLPAPTEAAAYAPRCGANAAP